jgi:UDPglucose 6-dehydrogenase
MRIGIIGQGFVGNAIYQKFSKYYDVLTYDLDESKSNSTKDKVLNQEIVFMCLPTPMNKDGSCNVDIIERELENIDLIADNQ